METSLIVLLLLVLERTGRPRLLSCRARVRQFVPDLLDQSCMPREDVRIDVQRSWRLQEVFELPDSRQVTWSGLQPFLHAQIRKQLANLQG